MILKTLKLIAVIAFFATSAFLVAAIWYPSLLWIAAACSLIGLLPDIAKRLGMKEETP